MPDDHSVRMSVGSFVCGGGGERNGDRSVKGAGTSSGGRAYSEGSVTDAGPQRNATGWETN